MLPGMNSRISTTLVLCLAVAVALGATAVTRGISVRASLFADVPVGAPYHDAIDSLQSQGVIKGYDDGLFHPERTVLRAELVTMLGKTLFSSSVLGNCPVASPLFSDVRSSDWFFPAVCIGKQNHMLDGYPDGSFRPGNPVTVAEAAKFIASFFHMELPTGTPWYKPFVEALAEKHALPLSLSGIAAPLKRGELAEMLDRISRNITDKEFLSYDQLTQAHAAAPANPQTGTLLLLLNAARETRNLAPLSWNMQLEQAATLFATDMDKNNFFSHDSPTLGSTEDRIRHAGYFTCNGCGNWSYRWGETLGRGATPEEVLKSWIDSPEHSSIIFSPALREIGIGASGDKWAADLGVILK
jgi:uncharacterized protein YkwD